MTDLEMTTLCAKAMGSELDEEGFGKLPELDRDFLEFYDPLHDDAHAMALVKKFRLHIEWDHDSWWVFVPKQGFDSDQTELNRAIVECVAQMEAAKVSA